VESSFLLWVFFSLPEYVPFSTTVLPTHENRDVARVFCADFGRRAAVSVEALIASLLFLLTGKIFFFPEEGSSFFLFLAWVGRGLLLRDGALSSLSVNRIFFSKQRGGASFRSR